ncbi:type II toxin-antitoxin system HicB family antitoxin [Candidatus Pacearchaeota archaeon]|nr:type II toxin-antitoxin system HicB family antitoxin [Candidatus Pacearchaeota archaeon]
MKKLSKELSCNVVIHKEDLEGKPVYVAECEELSVSDFGDSPEDALNNLKEALRLLISVEPEKADLLKKEEPVLLTRLYL